MNLKKANELFFTYFYCGLEANSSAPDNFSFYLAKSKVI